MEPLLVLTGILLAFVLAGYVRHDDFGRLVAHIAEWIGTLVEIP